MDHAENSYYIPHGSRWPFIGSVALFGIMTGASMWLNGANVGPLVFAAGLAILVFMMFGWFGTVIRESEGGIYNAEVDTSFRMGMGWFIFSEVMFFGAFFGTLFYARSISIPWLGLMDMPPVSNVMPLPTNTIVSRSSRSGLCSNTMNFGFSPAPLATARKAPIFCDRAHFRPPTKLSMPCSPAIASAVSAMYVGVAWLAGILTKSLARVTPAANAWATVTPSSIAP